MVMIKSCLNCKYMDEPESPHKWHHCTWWQSNPLPATAQVTGVAIDITHPHTDCPTWEQRGGGDQNLGCFGQGAKPIEDTSVFDGDLSDDDVDSLIAEIHQGRRA
mgnify:FL=1